MKLHGIRHAPGLTAAVLLVITGCGGATDEEPRTASVRESGAASTPSPTRTSTPTPTRSPVETPASATSAAAASGRTALSDRLLTSSEMPGLSDGFTWREAATRNTEGDEPFGTCQKYAMTSIGALRVVVREFVPAQDPDSGTASNLVADFPDGSTARRAFEVLKSWRGRCAEQLSTYDKRDVGRLQPVDVAAGTAGWYLLTYGPASGNSRDDSYLDAQGLIRVENRISLVQMRTVGQDYDYPPGHEPMSEAVRTAAGKLT